MREHCEKRSVCVRVCACGTWRALNLSAHGHSRLGADTKEHNGKLAPPASALHRRSLFNSDNQNIGRLEILVIWFSLVSSWGMNAFEKLVKKSGLLMVRLNQVYGAINQQTLAQAYPAPRCGARDSDTRQGVACSSTVFIYVILFFSKCNQSSGKNKTRI